MLRVWGLGVLGLEILSLGVRRLEVDGWQARDL